VKKKTPKVLMTWR